MYACLKLNAMYRRDEPLCSFWAASLKCQRRNKGCDILLILFLVRQAPPLGCVYRLLPVHARRKRGLKQHTEDIMVQTSLRKERVVTREPYKLARQPNNRKTVANVINPRGNHTICPCYSFSMTFLCCKAASTCQFCLCLRRPDPSAP